MPQKCMVSVQVGSIINMILRILLVALCDHLTFKKCSIFILSKNIIYSYLKVTGLSRGIGRWKHVKPPTIHPLGCGHSPGLAYAECFVYRITLKIQ